MGNACDCKIFGSPEDLRKTSFRVIKQGDDREWEITTPTNKTKKILRHQKSGELMFPTDLSPMARVKDPIESIEEKVQVYLKCELISGENEIQVNTYTEKNGRLNLLGQTELYSESNGSGYTKSFIIDFVFEYLQGIKFDILNIKDRSRPQSLGTVRTTVSKIVGAGGFPKSFEIIGTEGKVGTLYIETEGIRQNLSYAEFQISVSEHPKLGSSTLSYRILRVLGEAGYVPIYQSESIPAAAVNTWKKAKLRLVKLCNNDLYHSLKIQIISNSGKEETLIGESYFTLDEVINKKKDSFKLNNPILKKKSGVIAFNHMKIEEMPSFLDYIRGGIKLSSVVAIDFTKSNAEPNYPISLHNIYPDGRLNEYQQVIRGVSDILLDYDSDKKVPLYGFGAKLAYPNLKSATANHCFPLSGKHEDPFAAGFEGMMDLYKFALQKVQLMGPTLFHPILDAAMRIAADGKSKGSFEYTILLIITDGQINDQIETIELLVQASSLPMSVIIVGVGKEDFSDMRILDGDDGLCNAKGVRVQRDTTQFVAFRDFENDPELLVKAVLEEIPDQIVEYYTRIGMKPQSAKGSSVRGTEVDYLNEIRWTSNGFIGEDRQIEYAPRLENEIIIENNINDKGDNDTFATNDVSDNTANESSAQD